MGGDAGHRAPRPRCAAPGTLHRRGIRRHRGHTAAIGGRARCLWKHPHRAAGTGRSRGPGRLPL
jgi:hypothetical protein